MRQNVRHAAASPTSRTVAATAKCLEPDFPRLDAATRALVLADVSAFVASQVRALPDFLRWPYRLALVAFEWLPVLRFGRPFTALDLERRRAWVDFWTDAPLGLMRNFVKLMRSCALLAYYDHPALQPALRAQARRGGSSSDAPSPLTVETVSAASAGVLAG